MKRNPLFLLSAALLVLSLVATAAGAQDLFIGSLVENVVYRYDGATGAPRPSAGQSGAVFVADGLGGLSGPRGLAFGPDGNLYVASYATMSVLRYNGQTGAFIDKFVPEASGRLGRPLGLHFGPGGDLYVASQEPLDNQPTGLLSNINRYDGATGAPKPSAGNEGAIFASYNSFDDDSKSMAPGDLAFGPDGHLYVTDQAAAQHAGNRILRFDGATGAFLDVFATSVVDPVAMTLGPDGALYVAATTAGVNASVLRLDPATGAKEAFVTVDTAAGLAFGSDGNLYVGDPNLNRVRRYNGATGNLLGDFIPGGSGGLRVPGFLAFGPSGLGGPPSPIPEPGTLLLAALGLPALRFGFGRGTRRRRIRSHRGEGQ